MNALSGSLQDSHVFAVDTGSDTAKVAFSALANAVKGKFTNTNGTLTPVTDYVRANENNMSWARYGNVVVVSGWFGVHADIAHATKFFQLPYKSLIRGTVLLMRNDNDTVQAAYFEADSKDVKALDVTISSAWWYMQFVYITNE